MAPTIPEPQKFDNKQQYDVRYFSFSSISISPGGPTIETKMDKIFEDFYKDKWQREGKREFSVVVGPDTDTSTKCRLFNNQTDIFLSTVYKGAAQVGGVAV